MIKTRETEVFTPAQIRSIRVQPDELLVVQVDLSTKTHNESKIIIDAIRQNFETSLPPGTKFVVVSEKFSFFTVKAP